MRIDVESFQIGNYLNRSFSCACGKAHRADIEAVEIGGGVLGLLPGYIKKHGYQKPFVVTDQNTFAAAGRALLLELDGHEISYAHFMYPDARLSADERAAGRLIFELDPCCDVIIAVGAGTLNDICRMASCKLKLPYYIVATAPSMDGFASNVAAMTVGGVKVTYPAQTPRLILADTDVLCKAPMDMIAAGLGDMLGKYTCNADWLLSHIVTGEYRCPVIAQMMQKAVEKVTKNAGRLAARDPEAAGAVMEGLVLSGVAMSFVGNSRPASGSEHHLSHFWEMKFLQQGRAPLLHGTKVGAATVTVCRLYERLASMGRPDFEAARRSARTFDETLWETQIRNVYGSAASELIENAKRDGGNSRERRLERIRAMEANWDAISDVIAHLPASESVADLLKGLHAPSGPAEAGIGAALVYDALLYAKELRGRYTVLQLLWDLGLMEEFAKEAAA
ncbi:MAG TPA: sn-glycerol-1-phosphate dehydrogenase [Feifaniaceae bacterium]|nr:sn-glycerol-1-phosphate dehydrogenase [Feifaniaceae bacterium]